MEALEGVVDEGIRSGSGADTVCNVLPDRHIWKEPGRLGGRADRSQVWGDKDAFRGIEQRDSLRVGLEDYTAGLRAKKTGDRSKNGGLSAA